MKEKKQFKKPEIEIIEFINDDIVTLSGGTSTLNWGDGENEEDF